VSIVRCDELLLPYLSRPAVWATLDNGHQVIAIPKAGEVVHLNTMVRVGSIEETDANTGISHFLEHLMFKGTARYPAGAFDRLLEGVGGRVNASTARDCTQYVIGLPKGEADAYYHLALDLHADMLLNALLPDEEIGPPFDPTAPTEGEKRERMVVIEEIKMGKDNPWRAAIARLSELLYPTHPYRREVIGTAEVIASVPSETIRAYYRHWYQPANMVTIVASELEPLRVVDDVARAFLFPEGRPPLHPVFPADRPPTEPRIGRITMPLNVGYVLLGFLGPAATDLRTTVALDVLSLLLGEGLSSRIHQRLVEQLPDTPFFDAASTHWTHRDSSNLLAYGIVRPDAIGDAYQRLRDEVCRLTVEPPTTAELAKAVTILEAHFAAKAEMAAGLTSAVADSMANMGTPTGYLDYLPILRSLTPEELARTAADFLPLDHCCAVLLGPTVEETS
jgi:zinc protease